MKLNRTILFLWMSGALSIYGQSDLLKGKLIDASTIEPVAFATIAVKGRAVGVISNADGSFQVPQKFDAYGDTLQISSMGYEKTEILISTLSIDAPRRIYLQPGIFELEEAVVSARRKKRLSARKIVRRAIENIPRNYPFQPFSTVGYYRDYQLKKNEYVNLNEAILEVFDLGFQSMDNLSTKIQIYDYKQNSDFERDTAADDKYNYKNWKKVIDKAYLFNYGGNEFTILRIHDAIRNYMVDSYDFVNRIETDLFDNHNFYKVEDTYMENEALYTIKIMKAIPGYRLFGMFYISKKDFAIHKMEYAIYDRSKTNISNVQNKHGNTNQLIFEVTTEYIRKYSKMYLNYISFHNSFQLSRPPELIVNEIIADGQRGCFEVRYNKDVDPASAGAKNNYKFKFRGKKVKFKRIIVFDNAVRLHPDMPAGEISNMMEDLASASRKKIQLKELLETDIGGVRTPGGIESHVLNERKLSNYRQFREFFVQQIKPTQAVPKNVTFMDKKKPIFKDQPIVRPDNFDDYWMNTPLQKVEQ